MSARSVGATSLTQQSENFGYSAVRLRRIVKLQFGIINPTDLVRLFLLEREHEADGLFYCNAMTFLFRRSVI